MKSPQWFGVSYALVLFALAGQVISGQALNSRFSPPFRSDVHLPNGRDSAIIRILRNSIAASDASKTAFGLVHGHFLGDGTDAVAATEFRHVSTGDAVTTFLLSNVAGAMKLLRRDDSLNAAYCRVLSVSIDKDVLLCQANFVNARPGELGTNLYAIDFTQEPPDSWFLELRDTVDSRSQCRAWANLKSVDWRNGLLDVVVEYGRSTATARVFPRQLYHVDFRFGPTGFYTTEESSADFDYVTARWEGGRGQACSSARR